MGTFEKRMTEKLLGLLESVALTSEEERAIRFAIEKIEESERQKEETK